MIDTILTDPEGWMIAAVMVAAIVCIGVAFLCMHWGMAK